MSYSVVHLARRTTPAPELGDFAVVRTSGLVAFLIRLITRSTVNHAFVYVGDGLIVEAQPHGARMVTWAGRYPHAIWSTGVPALSPTPQQRVAIAKAARALAPPERVPGLPYNFVDVVDIGLADIFGHHVPEAVKNRLRDPADEFCSQLVDVTRLAGGFHLFKDKRLPGAVPPSDLLDLIEGKSA